jgi:hypothetical protein
MGELAGIGSRFVLFLPHHIQTLLVEQERLLPPPLLYQQSHQAAQQDLQHCQCRSTATPYFPGEGLVLRLAPLLSCAPEPLEGEVAQHENAHEWILRVTLLAGVTHRK